ncbi:MAG: PG0541 family transporter-associated protein [Bacteroidota bacterium]
MKSILIVFNQAHTEKVEYMLDRLEIRGYTQWNEIYGRGSETGEPHMGTHTWPEQNNAIIAVTEEEKVKKVLEAVEKMDNINKDVGIRAFVWNIEQMY